MTWLRINTPTHTHQTRRSNTTRLNDA